MINEFERYRIDFADLNNFTIQLNSPFILSITKDEVDFDFLIRVKKRNDKAIIFGSGAYDASSELEPPIFQRHKWMEHFDETLIFYNDPTLYLGEINIGWGFGTGDRHYLTEIAEILEILLEKINLKKEKTLFYGSSAGGFMSLLLGGLLKGSKVLVNNPQTIVWNYYDRHVNAMFETTKPSLSRKEIIESYSEKLNVRDFYKKIKYVPEITYLQNVTSGRDLTHHLNPFILGLSHLSDDYYTKEMKIQLYSDIKRGHNPIGINETIYRIKNTINN
ncbi:glycosyl transferase family 2 [Salipaludibacillus agaradhaerens]|uniref:glycosyl transferase family 2 n=1 Tax=Salipaludibacillus agaradhaerens TaxID=76935 RepID=UPI0009975D70|nr:glycosyl transferase family 2 [Salipaludibacillus agaradhaerens]UJW59001.1 glycosyl transferase family 2 [Bacillus sp. A116_S68]